MDSSSARALLVDHLSRKPFFCSLFLSLSLSLESAKSAINRRVRLCARFVLLRARREYHVIKRKVKFQNKRQRGCVCVRKKKSAMKEEIEREKSCFWDIFLLLLPLFLSLLSLFLFSESHTTRKKRTPLVSVLFRFLRDDDPHSFGAAAATFTRAHETTKQRKHSS